MTDPAKMSRPPNRKAESRRHEALVSEALARGIDVRGESTGQLERLLAQGGES